jgi:hypothetical protein
MSRNRALVAGGVILAIAALGAIAVAALPGEKSAPPTTIAAATTTPASPTTTAVAPGLAGPFETWDLVSHTGPVVENPLLKDAAASIFVDAGNGVDGAPGSLERPVATLEAARRLARAALESADGDVVVYLRGGLHPRTEAFTLTAADGGRGENAMIYRSYPGEQAVLEGGLRIDSWKPADGDIMVAAVPDSVDDMRQFFAGSQRQPRARSAAAEATAVDFVRGPLFGRQRNVAMTVDTELVAGFSHPEDLELVYIGVALAGHGIRRSDGTEVKRASWKSHRLPVAVAFDRGDGTTQLDIGNGALYQASERGYRLIELLPGDPFFFENAIELLDEPGEWFFDPRDRLLYWWPPDSAALDDAWIPNLEVLLDVNGTLESPVRNVRFEGLAFRHGSYTTPNEAGSVISQGSSWFSGWKPPDWMEADGRRHSFLERSLPAGHPVAAVQVDSASDVAFSSNVFTQLGGVAVMVHNDAHGIEFDGNLFVDISAEALVAGHPEHDVIDEPMEGLVTDLRFTNNVIDRSGAEFYGSVGVQVIKAGGAVISHNLFRDLPYTALSLGWGWEHNPASTVHRAIAVENNYFENVVSLLYDGAPLYVLGPVAEPGAALGDYTRIRGNFVNNAQADPQFKAPGELIDPGFAKRPGIQLDEGIRNIAIDDNVFLGATVWFQLTGWQSNRNVPGWITGLSLVGSGNWSDTPAAVPTDPTLVGVEQARLFDVTTAPAVVLEIATNAGLEKGITMPPLP